MKESKFIELLNLYVDHQISAEDAALLEAEIQRNVERRRIYRQYCQMQKACVALAENFRTEAPAAETAAAEKVVEFAPARRRMGGKAWAVGALAAAACAAFAFVGLSRIGRPGGDVLASRPALPPATVAVAKPAPTARSANELVALRPAFAGLVRESAAQTAGNDRVPLEWMNRVQLQRVPVEELWFEAQTTHQADDLMLQNRLPSQARAEAVAFRFQK